MHTFIYVKLTEGIRTSTPIRPHDEHVRPNTYGRYDTYTRIYHVVLFCRTFISHLHGGRTEPAKPFLMANMLCLRLCTVDYDHTHFDHTPNRPPTTTHTTHLFGIWIAGGLVFNVERSDRVDVRPKHMCGYGTDPNGSRPPFHRVHCFIVVYTQLEDLIYILRIQARVHPEYTQCSVCCGSVWRIR